MKTAPVIFVPTWVASAFRSNKLPMTKLTDANVLSQVLSDEDIVDYAQANQFSFIKKILAVTALDNAAFIQSGEVYMSYINQMFELSAHDRRLGKDKVDTSNCPLDFLASGLTYGALDKELFLRKFTPIIGSKFASRAQEASHQSLIERMSLNSYQKPDTAQADKSALDMDKHPGMGNMLFPVVVKDDDASTRQLFERGIFKVATTGSVVVVYLGDDYFNYCRGQHVAKERYDLAEVMPKDCMASTMQRYLLLSILQAMANMQKADKFVDYMQSYIYRFYMATITPGG